MKDENCGEFATRACGEFDGISPELQDVFDEWQRKCHQGEPYKVCRNCKWMRQCRPQRECAVMCANPRVRIRVTAAEGDGVLFTRCFGCRFFESGGQPAVPDTYIYAVESGEWYEARPELGAYPNESSAREIIAHLTRKPEWEHTDCDAAMPEDASVIDRWDCQISKEYIVLHKLLLTTE